ncbi:iron-containing alcohol dehydrogenase [Notoacmeibacter marinus]|uniref:iron-containing alcohol dehydrogenase n=1 Tax=Notoacmeibacter marinus TaxID=1876515 RepID=UPI000DF2368E|nr:iron-containing alcohol dehydrogenase [Notoacmeibacter marinus]
MPSPTFNWTELIDDICAGTWISPLTGKRYPAAPYDKIVFAETLKGREADLVSSLGFEGPFAVVCDPATFKAMGERVAKALRGIGEVTEIVLDHPHADMATVRDLQERLKPFPTAVAVGSGSINDLTKFATLQNGRRYCVFATAGSMNGYTSSTASITLDSGLKVSLPAQVPAGFFVDLDVCAAAPAWLNAAGFGDCLCRSVAQIDWWMSHRLLGTMYRHEPYLIEIPDEIRLMEQARGIAAGDIEAIGTLFRVLTLCGLGINFTGVSNHGSMGEHQISHYIDCFAGERHPGSTHGQQVGVTTLTMARLQEHFLSREQAPEVGPTQIDEADMARRMGPEVAAQCAEYYRKKAFDQKAADAFNERIGKLWPELREECLAMRVGPQRLAKYLEAAGGPTTAEALGIPVEFYREAVSHAHEMRDRFSFADIACDSGVLKQLASAEG